MNLPYPSVRAPGKALLFGEYAVLFGATAIVAAVDRDAVACVPEAAGRAPSPFVAAATRFALARLAAEGRPAIARPPVVDSSALFAGTRKLGLGSSAAVTVAAHGAVLAAAGISLSEKKPLLFRACEEAHAEAQGARGSGADVAAAVFGGVFAFHGGNDSETPVRAIAWPPFLEVTFVDTGIAASTADRVARWRDVAARNPDSHQALHHRMTKLAAAFFSAISANETASDGDALALVAGWNEALLDLGRQIDLEVVTPAHRRIDQLARTVGGAAKPSGAGGGDLAVCFTPLGASAALRAQLVAAGFDPLALAIGAPGASLLASEISPS